MNLSTLENPCLPESLSYVDQCNEIRRLQEAIRKHRDYRGDDRCWQDDEDLYRVLPEDFTPPARDCRVELAMCEKYIASRRNPATEYVSSQRRIEELELEIGKLQRHVEDLEIQNDRRASEVSRL